MGIVGERELAGVDNRLGVYEETAPLKKVLMWGAPGTEAALGQILPTDVSCFLERFDVAKARDEFNRAKGLLEQNGVEVIGVKDLYAQMVTDQEISSCEDPDELSHALKIRARELRIQYKRQDAISKGDLEAIDGWIDLSLLADVKQYGPEVATVINRFNCFSHNIPLSNLIYARDQSNLLGDTFVWSSMRHPIRQPEVMLYQMILRHSGLLKNAGVNEIEVQKPGRFEGGDGICFGNNIFVGVGGRTNMEGIRQVAPTLLKGGKRLFVPVDVERAFKGAKEMGAMHLDTYLMPFGDMQIVSCDDETCRRELVEVTMRGRTLKFTRGGVFTDFLRDSGYEIVPLTKDEQDHFAPNYLNLGGNKVVLSLSDGNNLTQELTTRGMTVYCANLENITKGYGGLHCMTAAIERG